jgi:hypothetical protein
MSVNEVTSPEWEFDRPDDIDLSTVEKEFIEYRDVNVNIATTQTKYEIETRDKDAYLLPHEGYVDVRYHIHAVGTPAAALPAGTSVTIQNNVLSLFKYADYFIEDQQVEHIDNPGLARTIKGLSVMSKENVDSIESNQHFCLDTHDGFSPSVRFFNTNAARKGYELFFNLDVLGNMTPDATANPTGAATWQNADTVEAWLGSYGSGIKLDFITSASAGFTPALTAATPNTVTIAGGKLNVTGAQYNLVGIRYKGRLCRFLAGGQPAAATLDAANIIKLTNGIAVANQVDMPVSVELPAEFLPSGAQKRLAYTDGTSQNAPACVQIPLKDIFGFCEAFDKISRGLRHKVIFEKAAAGDALYRDSRYTGTTDYDFTIDHISMWIPRLKPDLKTMELVENKLKSGEIFNVNFTDLTCTRPTSTSVLTGPASNSSANLSSTSKKPVRLFAAFQRQSRVDSGQTVNKRVFDHVNTNAIHTRLNGKIFPYSELKLTAGSQVGMTRAYRALMDAGYKMRDNSSGSPITLRQFMDIYPIFHFDMTHQDEDLYKFMKQAELEVRWSNSFAAIPNGPGTTEGYHLWVVYESERLIKFKPVSGALAIVS